MLQKAIEVRSVWDGKGKIGFHSIGTDVALEVTIANDDDGFSPEKLFIMSISSCFMKTFLSLAAHANLQISEFMCNAVATYNLASQNPLINQITLTPTLVVTQTHFIRNAVILLEKAHRNCILINTLNAQIVFAPHVKTV